MIGASQILLVLCSSRLGCQAACAWHLIADQGQANGAIHQPLCRLLDRCFIPSSCYDVRLTHSCFSLTRNRLALQGQFDSCSRAACLLTDPKQTFFQPIQFPQIPYRLTVSHSLHQFVLLLRSCYRCCVHLINSWHIIMTFILVECCHCTDLVVRPCVRQRRLVICRLLGPRFSKEDVDLTRNIFWLDSKSRALQSQVCASCFLCFPAHDSQLCCNSIHVTVLVGKPVACDFLQANYLQSLCDEKELTEDMCCAPVGVQCDQVS